MKTTDNVGKGKIGGRRKVLMGLGMGVGGLLAFGGTAGLLRFVTRSKSRRLPLLRRRSRRLGLPAEDSIFYPRDRDVRRKLAG